MITPRELHWYIVQTKPTAEDQVRKRWEQAGYEVFLPKICQLVRGVSRPVERTKPLFPSYLFTRCDLDNATTFRDVRYTRGVRRILGGNNHPLPVHESIIVAIREQVNKEGVLEQSLILKAGDRVRVRRGPLADLVGILKKPVSAAGRVRVLLDVYHKLIHAELFCSEVERLA